MKHIDDLCTHSLVDAASVLDDADDIHTNGDSWQHYSYTSLSEPPTLSHSEQSDHDIEECSTDDQHLPTLVTSSKPTLGKESHEPVPFSETALRGKAHEPDRLDSIDLDILDMDLDELASLLSSELQDTSPDPVPDFKHWNEQQMVAAEQSYQMQVLIQHIETQCGKLNQMPSPTDLNNSILGCKREMKRSTEAAEVQYENRKQWTFHDYSHDSATCIDY